MEKTHQALDVVLKIGFLDIDCHNPGCPKKVLKREARRQADNDRQTLSRQSRDNIYTTSKQFLDSI